MKTSCKAICFLLFIACTPPQKTLPLNTATKPSPLLNILTEESQRIIGDFQFPPIEFLSYEVHEQQEFVFSAFQGATLQRKQTFKRILSIQMDIEGFSYFGSEQLPLEDNPAALGKKIRYATETLYRDSIINPKSSDFLWKNNPNRRKKPGSKEVFWGKLPARFSVEQTYWEEKYRKLSKNFPQSTQILPLTIGFSFLVENKYIADSEGTQIQFFVSHMFLQINGTSYSEDGELIEHLKTFYAKTPAQLPREEEIQAAVSTFIQEIEEIRVAPVLEESKFPVLLAGIPAGIFFHELIGHRFEGNPVRFEPDLLDWDFLSTLEKESILIDFISIHDDPQIPSFEGVELSGAYPYDDQGVQAQRVLILENGFFKNFLLSRNDFEQIFRLGPPPPSNGHGRRQAGYPVVARQGNLFIESKKTVSKEELRKLLIEETKRQGKPFGLFVTYAKAGHYQYYKSDLMPLIVYRVYTDGRPDELVRGFDFGLNPEGEEILAAGGEYEVFNGFCNAESGRIPVSAIAPSILIRSLKTRAKPKAKENVPVLSSPLTQVQP